MPTRPLHVCVCQDDVDDDEEPAGDDADEDEEGFVVGDGYLSEDEGLRDEDGDTTMTPAGGTLRPMVLEHASHRP